MEEILKAIPHRYPFLLVDKVIELNKDDISITTIKNVTYNEPFFQGHFPDFPIMPGFLILESMAQTAMLLKLLKETQDNDKSFIVAVDEVRFIKPVVPGDQLKLYAKLIFAKNNIYKIKTQATVNDFIVAKATITSTNIKDEKNT
jgi:3-hydroxyacyl-[acyl-carrier-protein] dehydratase